MKKKNNTTCCSSRIRSRKLELVLSVGVLILKLIQILFSLWMFVQAG